MEYNTMTYNELQNEVRELRKQGKVNCKLTLKKQELIAVLEEHYNTVEETIEDTSLGEWDILLDSINDEVELPVKKAKFNGLILHKGKSPLDNKPIVVIVTGLSKISKNTKTGDMLQTWIIREDLHPLESIHSGEDYSICGNCIHRQQISPSGKRTCYVNLSAVGQVYKSYLKGNYPTFDPEKHLRYFTNRFIRWGSYGDPVCIPYKLIELINSVSIGHTGYTHQWRNDR